MWLPLLEGGLCPGLCSDLNGRDFPVCDKSKVLRSSSPAGFEFRQAAYVFLIWTMDVIMKRL